MNAKIAKTNSTRKFVGLQYSAKIYPRQIERCTFHEKKTLNRMLRYWTQMVPVWM